MMDKIVVTAADIEKLLAWRDEHNDWCEKCAVGGKKSTSCGFCYGLDGLRIRRPPQSWCYVAEAEEDDAL